MKKLFALLLVLAMTLSLFAGCKEEKPAEEKVETTEATEATEPAPREPLVPELEEGADILTFRYEEKYLNMYYEKLEAYEAAALDNDQAKVDALDLDLEELAEFIYDQNVIAEVLHYCNTKDEEIAERHLEMNKLLLDMADAEILAMRRIYKSDSKLVDHIFEDWTEEDIQYMLDYTSEVTEIQKEQAEVLVDVREMEDDELEEEAGAYYSQLVAGNNRTAEIFGYDSYYEYAYATKYDRDYTIEEVEILRGYVKEHALEIFEAAIDRFYENYEELSSSQQRKFSEMLYSDYDETDYLEEYLEDLPDGMGEEMLTMLEDGWSVFPKGAKAREGAFTTLISGHPFCYFSRGYKTMDTLAHEMGHYYAALHGDMGSLPLDLAEIQSQGNEWLMIVHSADEMNEELYECYLDYRFANDIVTVLISVLIDEFEQEVYALDSVEGFTTEDFDEIIKEIAKEYGGAKKMKDAIGVDICEYWRQVSLEHPGYYISYAVSMIPSLDIFFSASEDWDAAVKIYQDLTLNLDEEAEFLETLEKVGLATPFEDTVFNKLLKRYELIEAEEEAKAA